MGNHSMNHPGLDATYGTATAGLSRPLFHSFSWILVTIPATVRSFSLAPLSLRHCSLFKVPGVLFCRVKLNACAYALGYRIVEEGTGCLDFFGRRSVPVFLQDSQSESSSNWKGVCPSNAEYLINVPLNKKIFLLLLLLLLSHCSNEEAELLICVK